tara:strand:- start:52 stop:498 length:447 start_codon:yes stop_codon:yes gene_type:complete
MITEGLKLRGDVALVLRDKNGNIKDKRDIRNLIVDAGLNFICDRMKDDETAMTHMALGSGTTAAAAGDTSLESQLGSREALDSDAVSGNTITYTSSFEAGDATGAVSESAIFNAASGGTMLCRTVFAVVNKAADDSLSISWSISLQAS